jgi:hypothetical protein
MAATNVQAFSGDVEISSILKVGGQPVQPQRRWDIDLTAQETDKFYPIALEHGTVPTFSTYFPVNFKVVGIDFGGDNDYNESTLIGYARGGGYSDHEGFCKVHYRRFLDNERRYQGIYEGSQTGYNVIVIYMRGGYTYSLYTDADDVIVNISAFTRGNATFAIKNQSGDDVAGTSANIIELQNIADSSATEQTQTTGGFTVSGNVGIGLSNPSYKLDVNGTLHAGVSYFDGIHVGGSTSRGITQITGQYGSVSTLGSGTGSYAGYAIRDDWVFMSDGPALCGIFNDTDNGWGIICRQNASTEVYYNGSSKMQTTNDGIHVSGRMEANYMYVDDYIYHNGDTNTFLGFDANDNFIVYTNNSRRININSGGQVGINNSAPNVPLRVSGGNNPAFNSQHLHYISNYNINLTRQAEIYPTSYLPGYSPIAIYSDHAIGCQTYLFTHGGGLTGSDIRIKKDIVHIDDEAALDTLRLLQPKQYKYKDTFMRGEDPVWGFIAQEVANVLPYSVQMQTEYIPNIMEIVHVSDSNIITFSNLITSNLESNATSLRLKTFEGDEHYVDIVEIINDTSIRVDEDLTPYLRSLDETGNLVIETTTTVITPEEYNNLTDSEKAEYTEDSNTYVKTSNTYIGDQLFVYGQKVDNFHFLKKESIFTIATAALQEVDRHQQADKVRITNLETQLTSVLARLDALESA